MIVRARIKPLAQNLMLLSASTVIAIANLHLPVKAQAQKPELLPLTTPSPVVPSSVEELLEQELFPPQPVFPTSPLEQPANSVEELLEQELFPPQPASNTQTTNLVIKLSDRRVYVYRGDQLQTSYPIAVGKSGWETPKGDFKVIEMQRNPAWQHPWNGKIIPSGPGNPLGARWIGFWTDGKNFVGFHGTPQENLIGQAVSHGCVRMRNRDILMLYAQVKIGTPVSVVP